MARCEECLHYDLCNALELNGIDKVPASACGCYKNAADVVEVVRCRDCKYSEIDENYNLWCTFYNGKIREMPNGYCWHGERSE